VLFNALDVPRVLWRMAAYDILDKISSAVGIESNVVSGMLVWFVSGVKLALLWPLCLVVFLGWDG